MWIYEVATTTDGLYPDRPTVIITVASGSTVPPEDLYGKGKMSDIESVAHELWELAHPSSTPQARENVKAKLLAAFKRFNLGAGQPLPVNWVLADFRTTLDPAEHAEYPAAIDELKADDFITVTPNGTPAPVMALTEKGVNRVYRH